MAKRKKITVKISSLTLVLLSLFLSVLIVTFNQRDDTTNTSSQTEKLSTQSAKPVAKLTQTPSPKPQYFGFCLNVPILLYHHVKSLNTAGSDASLTVDTSIFDAQMQYLINKGYHTISIMELAQALITRQTLPPKSIAITLDDGYEDLYSNAYPILYKYQLKGNLMIPTGLLGNPGYIIWDQLKRMVDTGLIYAYDHTWSHANLGGLSERDAKIEILTAKKQLEEKLGKQVFIFAYPYGSEDQRIVNLLKENGFIAAVSTIPGSTQCDSFIMTLHRTRIGNALLSQYGI